MADDGVFGWFHQLPPITRTYMTACAAVSFAVQFDFVSFLQLTFNWERIMWKREYWRLITHFLFFGKIGLDFFFHMYFLVRYAQLLETGPQFRNKPADFFYMLLFCATLLTLVAPFVHSFFFGSALVFCMVYVWSRRNPYALMNFLGAFNFTAPYLPWVLMAFGLTLGHSPIMDLLGIGVGHIYYVLADVFPETTRRTGKEIRLLATPTVIKWLFEGPAEPVEEANPDAPRPGGFAFGQDD
eukprot:Clim_evm29s128 gene=Clim_evmTU29s128